MGELADQIDTVPVRAAVPGAVSAELRGQDLRLEFAPGYYRTVSEHSLEQALAGLCRILFAARAKAYDQLVRAAGGTPVPRERATDPLDQGYYARLDTVLATGSSADGRVRVELRGLRDWTVTLDLGRLREGEFVERAREAAGALIRDVFEKVVQVEQQVYNPLLQGRAGPA